MLHPEVEQKFRYVIEQNIAAGFVRGQDLFMEALDEDLQKNLVLEKHTIDGVMGWLLTEGARAAAATHQGR